MREIEIRRHPTRPTTHTLVIVRDWHGVTTSRSWVGEPTIEEVEAEYRCNARSFRPHVTDQWTATREEIGR